MGLRVTFKVLILLVSFMRILRLENVIKELLVAFLYHFLEDPLAHLLFALFKEVVKTVIENFANFISLEHDFKEVEEFLVKLVQVYVLLGSLKLGLPE